MIADLLVRVDPVRMMSAEIERAEQRLAEANREESLRPHRGQSCLVRVFYFGPWGAAGHYLWTPAGDHPRPETAGPWSPRDLDADSYKRDYGGRTVALPGGFCPSDPEERQGVWRLTRGTDAAGATWTAIGAWDRTCDRRGGCKAIFIAEGAHDEAAMRAIAAERFPAVWARIMAGGAP